MIQQITRKAAWLWRDLGRLRLRFFRKISPLPFHQLASAGGQRPGLSLPPESVLMAHSMLPSHVLLHIPGLLVKDDLGKWTPSLTIETIEELNPMFKI